MRQILLSLCLLVGLMAVSPLPAQANPHLCPFSNGEILFPRERGGQVELVSWVTGDVIQTLVDDSAIPTDEFNYPFWTQDCRYLSLSFGRSPQQTVILYEVQPSGAQEIGRFSEVVNYRWWNDDRFLILGAGGRTLIWQVGAGGQIWVDHADYLQTLTLDTARNQMFGVPTNRDNRVLAIDLGSGAVVGDYHIGERDGGKRGVNYSIAGDFILVGADHQTATGGAIWQRSTGWTLQVDGQWRVWQFSYNISVSPDNRYVVVSRGGGTIFVWDLTQLSGESPYPYQFSLPNRNPELGLRRGSVAWQYMSLRWRDNVTLEGMKTADLRSTIELYRWNVAENTYLYYDSVQRAVCSDADFIATYPERDLLEWGCAILGSS